MGHHYNTIRGVGIDRKEAEAAAVSDFLYEHGHRHSVRGVESAKLVRKVPPKKQVEEPGPRIGRWGDMRQSVLVRQVDDFEAPPEKWLEEWEFELHTHA